MKGSDSNPALPGWKLFFAMFFSPQRAAGQNIPWAFAYSVSGLAFMLLFLQTGLDLQRAGKIGGDKLVQLALIGLALGTAGVLLIACLAWAGARLSGTDHSLPQALRQFGLAYSPALLYGLCGLLMNLAFQWNTALAFGVTGMLWALGPVAVTIRLFTRDKIVPALLLTTVCGAAMLAGWAWLGGVI